MNLNRAFLEVVASKQMRPFLANIALVALAFVSVFSVGRATGLVPVVAYEIGAQSRPWKSSIEHEINSIGGPAFLKKGEKLVAKYDILIESGKVKLKIYEGPAPLWRDLVETHEFEESGKDRYEFVAPEDGIYWPRTEFGTSYTPEKCKEYAKDDHMVLQIMNRHSGCFSIDASFSIWWGVET